MKERDVIKHFGFCLTSFRAFFEFFGFSCSGKGNLLYKTHYGRYFIIGQLIFLKVLNGGFIESGAFFGDYPGH